MLSKPQATLLAFLALSSFTQASWLDDTVDDLVRRQGTDDAAGARPTIESVVPPVTTSSTLPTVITDSSSTSIVPPTTDLPSSTSTTPPTTSSAPPTTSSSVSSTIPSSSSSELPTTSSTIVDPTPTPSSSIPTTTPTPPASTQSQTIIRITKTETVDGQVRTSISESTSMSPVATDPASLNQSKETNGSSMSPKTRSTIIGVVVGLGGAVLLGGLAVVAYRIWGRKKGREETDDFYDHKRPDTMEKAGGSSGSGSSNPFKSTLENYHNPAKVNASSNF